MGEPGFGIGNAATEQQRLHALLAGAVTEPRLLAWRYDAPAIVLGRSQRAAPDVLERAHDAGIAIVGRASGGGAVLAGPWMASITLVLPVTHPWARASLPAGYREAGQACHRALAERSIITSLADCRRVLAPGEDLGWACFAEASHGELLANGMRKIVGLCQLRRREFVALCIGVLLARPDWALLLRAWLGRDEPALASRLDDCTAHCDEFTADSPGTIVEALVGTLQEALPPGRLAA